MQQRRKYQRFPIELPAVCYDGVVNNHPCKIIGISRAGVLLKASEVQSAQWGPHVLLEVQHPGKDRTVGMLVKLCWSRSQAERQARFFLAGGEIMIIDGQARDALLHYAHEQLMRAERFCRLSSVQIPFDSFFTQPIIAAMGRPGFARTASFQSS